jgi:dihydrofolate reductase
MGRKTFESIVSAIGKPLPGRESYILTRDTTFNYPGVHIFHDPLPLWAMIEDAKKEWVVIGGAEIYRLFLPGVDKIYLTQVEADLPGDAFFPSLKMAEWDIHRTQVFEKNEWNEYGFKILELWRKKRKNPANSE